MLHLGMYNNTFQNLILFIVTFDNFRVHSVKLGTEWWDICADLQSSFD